MDSFAVSACMEKPGQDRRHLTAMGFNRSAFLINKAVKNLILRKTGKITEARMQREFFGYRVFKNSTSPMPRTLRESMADYIGGVRN